MTGRPIVIGLPVAVLPSFAPTDAPVAVVPALDTLTCDVVRMDAGSAAALAQAMRRSPAAGSEVTEAFTLSGSSESSSEDDVDGATGKRVHAELRVSADSIVRTLHIEDRHESPDGDPRKVERKMRTEMLRLVHDPRAEKFVVRGSTVTR